MAAVTHPRLAPRRGTAGTWWSKACLRAVEEAAYSTNDLRAGRALARAGAVGGITVDSGSVVAAVTAGDDTWTVSGTVPVLDQPSLDAFVELVGAEAGRIGALMAGQLPHPLVEAVEEAGVELLPYGGELGSACTCQAWLDPCPHALAVFTQLAWLIQADPFVLLQLRGLPRDVLLQRLHALDARRSPRDEESGEADDLAVAEDAAVRAARLVAAVDDPDVDPDELERRGWW
jgi:uncharacterized Zn finger protein